MRRSLLGAGAWLAWTVTLGSASWAAAETWSHARGDAQRTGYAPVTIPVDVELAWTYRTPQPPSPAWPPPARGSIWQRLAAIAPRVVDDHAFHLVLTDQHVLFGSSADDSIRALRRASGELAWLTTTDGPVRYAPVATRDRVYVGSDDGRVYALEEANGRIAWRRALAPRDDQVIGNHRLISAWPVRTGLVVDGDTVYAAAGLFPAQQVLAVALDAATGAPRWQSELPDAAQGYLLTSRRALFVPTGRGTPLALDRATGSVIGQLDGAPGSYALVADQALVAGRGNDGTLSGSDMATRERLASYPGSHMAAAPQFSYLLGHGRLTKLDRAAHWQVSREIAQCEQALAAVQKRRSTASAASDAAALRARLARLESARDACELWSQPADLIDALVVADNAVVIGGAGGVAALAVDDGRVLWRAPVAGRVLSLALADDGVVASDHLGHCHYFRDAQASAPAESVAAAANVAPAVTPSAWTSAVVDELERRVGAVQGEQPRGLIVLAGAGDGVLAETLAARRWQVVVLERAAEQVVQWRNRWIADGRYGASLSIQWAAADRLPLVDYLATAVLTPHAPAANAAPPPWSRDELLRIVSPAGGLLWLDLAGPPQVRPALPQAGSWVHQYANLGNTANSGDAHVTGRLALQWFGGPGPQTMVDRHLRAPAPLAADGRLLVLADDRLLCVDAYNGSLLWQLATPGAQRYSMPYDAGYASLHRGRLALAVERELWLIDVARGEIVRRIPIDVVAEGGGETPHAWSYVALSDVGLLATVHKATAPRRAATYAQVDVDYTNAQPLVTSDAVVLIDPDSGQLRWRRSAVLVNATLACDANRLWAVTADPQLLQHATGRIDLAELMENSPQIVGFELATGREQTRFALPQALRGCRNVLYLQAIDGMLLVSGSLTRERDTWYRLAALDGDSGAVRWEAEHPRGKPDEFTHGEQVHHPAICDGYVAAEPVLYDLKDGSLRHPAGLEEPWRLVRPGHSCGTLSASASCLFFRASNPTVLDLDAAKTHGLEYRSLAPTRPGCWINIVPANGLVLIPEASASCVCHYALQTSMAFRPLAPAE